MWSARDEAIISAAQELGYLTPEQARDSKASFEAVSQAGMKVSLERLLLDKRYLSRPQLKRVFAELHARGFHPTIGPYEILEKLGAGASATVYKALDKRTERIVALKVLSHAMAADGQTAERFVRGAMLAAKVEHPNIARIFESGQDGRDYFMAMEYVEGTLLSRKAAPGAPIPEREALEITKQIASALDACHKLGIVHRDVKPSNIIVTVSGLAKLTDLGIAREVKGGADDLTLTGHSIGTPHYMSPEQCASSKEVDGRSDIYSLGATLFFMLTGQPPFSGDSVFEVMRQQSTSQLPNPRQFNRQISDMTHSLLWKMMAKTPEGRPQTAAELIAGIERVERMLADGSHVADEMQELLAEIAEPAEREKLGRSILRRVKAIDKRLEAVKKLSATWKRYAAFVKEAREGAAFTAEDEAAFAALGRRISREYLAALPLLERPDRGRPVIKHCEQGLSLSATAQDRLSLDALEKGCQAGAKLLHDFQEFLEQSRRKTISESFLRYSLAKYLGTPRRQIGAGIGLVLMICLSWFLIAQLYGKAANVAYEQSKATEEPATRKTAPALAATAPVAVKSRPASTATAPAKLVKSEQQRSVLALNGEQGGIRVKYNPIFDVRTAMTVEAWIRVEDPPSGIIVTRDNPKLGPWQFIFSDKGLLRADVAWGNWNLTPESSCRAIPTRKWIHVAMVYDGRVVRNYVNGKKVVSFPTCEKLLVNDNDIRIGYAPIWPVSTGRTFKGQIAEVRLSGAAIYDRDFTPQPRLTKAPTTLLLLPLDEGSGSVAKDASGHGNDGVITNGTWAAVSREEFQIAASSQGSGPRAPATAVGEKALPTDSPRRVLLDMSHNFTFAESNGLCDPNAYLERKAYVVMDTEAGLREDVLKEFDVLVLFQQSADAQYTQKDADLVKSLLERGGGVMLYADAGSCHGGLPLNRIAREFGVEFLPDAAQGPITGAPGYDGTISLSPRLLRIDAGVKYTPIARDKAGRPVIISMEWKKGRIVAVSGSDLVSNSANRGPRRNTATVQQLFQRLASTQVADESVDVLGLARTYPTRIDPDRVIEAGGFRFLCPDPLPEERVKFLREKAAAIYSAVSEQFGYETAEQKTIIGLMCAGSGWTASPTLMGIGVLGDEVGVASVLIHESSNSLCIEAPVWLGDAGWSAYVQIKVKTALGGRFAENVKGQLQRQIAEYHKWESAHGLYDLASEKDVYVGEGKVMEIISGFEKKYGPDIMKRYFAAARKWMDDPAVKSHPISDRVVFYFSQATGEDQYPYFKKLGTSVQRIDLPVKPEQNTSQRPEESVPAPGMNP
jgi:serine/threonine protein kinase